MAQEKVQQIAREIQLLTDIEREELIMEVLPSVLSTQGVLQAMNSALELVDTEDLDAIVEHARHRNSNIPETDLSLVIRNALKVSRASRSH